MSVDKSLTLESVIHDMLDISGFAYDFRSVRDVVRDHGETVGDGRGCDDHEEEEKAPPSKSWWRSAPPPVKRVKFIRPELIITDKQAKTNENRNFAYAVTPAAILEFMSLNRKFYTEDEKGTLDWDETETEKDMFVFEKTLLRLQDENLKILDFDDSFSTDVGGLVYGVILNVTHKWVGVVFRGTIGATDIATDRNFVFDHGPYERCITDSQKPGSHMGFTEYLFTKREHDSVDRLIIDRIMASVDDAFENNPEVTKDFKLYTTGHSLGGGLSNLFAFHVAHKKEQNDEDIKHLPKKITAMTFAAPVIGNADLQTEYQSLEKQGFLRHVRVSNEGDLVPTNSISFPFSLAIKGDSTKYVQNGMNLFLKPKGQMETDYVNTKTCTSQLHLNPMNNLACHLLPMYRERVALPENEALYDQTIEDLYKKALMD